MRLYRTEAHREKPKWSGSQAQAAKDRKDFIARGTAKSDVATEEVEVPTSKADLIDWLNDNQV